MNRWCHVAGVFDGAAQTVKLYIDGAVVEEGTVGFGTLHDSSAPFAIGMNYDSGAPIQPFEGLVDEARVYAKALSRDEIRALMMRVENLDTGGVFPGLQEAHDDAGTAAGHRLRAAGNIAVPHGVRLSKNVVVENAVLAAPADSAWGYACGTVPDGAPATATLRN
ncbi:MAG: LamG domain-containing protein, partial [Planctomycetota bacterium]